MKKFDIYIFVVAILIEKSALDFEVRTLSFTLDVTKLQSSVFNSSYK